MSYIEHRARYPEEHEAARNYGFGAGAWCGELCVTGAGHYLCTREPKHPPSYHVAARSNGMIVMKWAVDPVKGPFQSGRAEYLSYEEVEKLQGMVTPPIKVKSLKDAAADAFNPSGLVRSGERCAVSITDPGSSAGGATGVIAFTSPLHKPCEGTTADGRPCARVGGHTVCFAWTCSKCEQGLHDKCDSCYAFFGRQSVNPSVGMQWDTQEQRLYHNGGWTISVRRVAGLQRFKDELSVHLAPWLKE